MTNNVFWTKKHQGKHKNSCKGRESNREPLAPQSNELLCPTSPTECFDWSQAIYTPITLRPRIPRISKNWQFSGFVVESLSVLEVPTSFVYLQIYINFIQIYGSHILYKVVFYFYFLTCIYNYICQCLVFTVVGFTAKVWLIQFM